MVKRQKQSEIPKSMAERWETEYKNIPFETAIDFDKMDTDIRELKKVIDAMMKKEAKKRRRR